MAAQQKTSRSLKAVQLRLLTLLLLCLPCSIHAEARIWKNSDATRSFSGTLVKREADKVTIKMTANGRIAVIKPEQLHAKDIEWLRKNHPFDHEIPKNADPEIAPGSFYDTLSFGDDRATVIKKLKASKRFHSQLDATFFARTGLNGTFHTTKGNEFFGMRASLYYGWDDNHGLKFLSLYGHETPQAQVESSLIPLWQEMTKNITGYFGKPTSAYHKPDYANLTDGGITFTHVWPMKAGGYLLLGVGRQEGTYILVTRFSSVMP